MLQVIDEFKQVHSNNRLTNKSHEKTAAHPSQGEQESTLEHQRSAGVHRTRPKGTFHLFWNRLEHVCVDASPPRRGRGVNIPCPVAVMRVVVLRGEVQVKHGKE